MRSITKPALAVIRGIHRGRQPRRLLGRRRRRRRPPREDEHVHPLDRRRPRRARPADVGGAARCSRCRRFAYDTLVSVDDERRDRQRSSRRTGAVDGTTVTLTLNDGITCSDGSEFTAQTAADNITWIDDPENQSPFLGAFLPAGITAEADGEHPHPHARRTGAVRAPGPREPRRWCATPGLDDRIDPRRRRRIGTGPYVLDRGRPERPLHLRAQRGLRVGPERRDHRGGGPARHGHRAGHRATRRRRRTCCSRATSTPPRSSAPTRDRLDAAGLFAQEIAGPARRAVVQPRRRPRRRPTRRCAWRSRRRSTSTSCRRCSRATRASAATALAVIPPTGCVVRRRLRQRPRDRRRRGQGRARRGRLGRRRRRHPREGRPEAEPHLPLRQHARRRRHRRRRARHRRVEGASASQVDATQQDSTDDHRAPSSAPVRGTSRGSRSTSAAPTRSSASSPARPPLRACNFASHRRTTTTTARVAEAMAHGRHRRLRHLGGRRGRALHQAADVVPFANSVVPTFGKDAEFALIGNIEPTSIRMLG